MPTSKIKNPTAEKTWFDKLSTTAFVTSVLGLIGFLVGSIILHTTTSKADHAAIALLFTSLCILGSGLILNLALIPTGLILGFSEARQKHPAPEAANPINT